MNPTFCEQQSSVSGVEKKGKRRKTRVATGTIELRSDGCERIEGM